MSDKITIKDIARLSGVGISTVSRVVNGRPDVGEETRRRVMEVVAREGYVPNGNAKHLKQKSSNYIAVIIRGMQNIFLTSIVEKLQKHIEANGYSCLVTYIDEHEDEITEARRIYNEKKVLGIVFVGGDTTGRRQELADMGIPCVFTTTRASGVALDNVSSVCVDDRAGACIAVEYLFSKGHRDIAVVGGELEAENSIGLRYKGVLECYAKHGREFDQAMYISTPFSFKKSYEAVRGSVESGLQFTALFAMSDVMAVGAAKAITDCGMKVPDDISIIGFDGTDYAKFYNPSLATVKQPREELAQQSVMLLVQTLEKAAPGAHLLLDTQLVEAGSVRDLNQG